MNWSDYKTDKATRHAYDRVYPLLMRNLPTDSVVLEVGVQHGGSLCLWHDMLPQCTIVGVDIIPRPNMPDDIIYHQMDAYTKQAVEKLSSLYANKCSMIIDDGSHLVEDICFFANNYLVLLQKNGIMVLEDIPGEDGYKQVFPRVPEALQPFKVDLRLCKGSKDDILIVGGLS